MKPVLPLLVAAALAGGAISSAHATEQPWLFRVGTYVINPTSGNGHLAGMKTSIDSDTEPTASLEYLITPSWGIDLLAALPHKHDIKLDGQLAV